MRIKSFDLIIVNDSTATMGREVKELKRMVDSLMPSPI
jgi:hypothetical protein